MGDFTWKLSWDLTLSNERKRPLFCIFPSEILHNNHIKWKKRKRVSFPTSKLVVRRQLDEVTRVKLSRASCVTRVARSLSVSLLSSPLANLSISRGSFLVHRDFSFSRECTFSGLSACVASPFTRKFGPVSRRHHHRRHRRCQLFSARALNVSW